MSRTTDPLDELREDEESFNLGRRVTAWLWDLVKTWGPALLTVLVIRSVVAEPFRIPSGSMVPTLEIGDYILVNKFAYGLRFPFTSTKLLPVSEPKRGEIIVFKYPLDPSLDYIKRVVGVAGDEIKVRGNALYVNGEEQGLVYMDSFQFIDDRCAVEATDLYMEDLGELQHQLLHARGVASPLGDYGPGVVPPDTVFVMGDNRDNSSDSRRWGAVPMSYIKGRAMVVWLSYDHCSGRDLGLFQLGTLRMNRFGTVLH